MPVSGSDSSKSFSRLCGVASDVTFRESSVLAYATMTSFTMRPNSSCCVAMSSVMFVIDIGSDVAGDSVERSEIAEFSLRSQLICGPPARFPG